MKEKMISSCFHVLAPGMILFMAGCLGTGGGGALAPAPLNVKQSDALGYQYALLYKLFAKWAPYIDHIISWGLTGSGWQGSYVLFDDSDPARANAGYYDVMEADIFIIGHPYLESYFAGKYEKLQTEGQSF